MPVKVSEAQYLIRWWHLKLRLEWKSMSGRSLGCWKSINNTIKEYASRVMVTDEADAVSAHATHGF